jgi:hypothetical protein
MWASLDSSRTKSMTTKDNIRKQCAKALKNDACDINAQDYTLRNVTRARFRTVYELFAEHNGAGEEGGVAAVPKAGSAV